MGKKNETECADLFWRAMIRSTILTCTKAVFIIPWREDEWRSWHWLHSDISGWKKAYSQLSLAFVPCSVFPSSAYLTLFRICSQLQLLFLPLVNFSTLALKEHALNFLPGTFFLWFAGSRTSNETHFLLLTIFSSLLILSFPFLF